MFSGAAKIRPVAIALFAVACGSDGAIVADDSTTTTAAPTSTEPQTTSRSSTETTTTATTVVEERPILELELQGLDPLGDDFDYEGWVIVDGEPISTGAFDLAADGTIEADEPFHAPDAGEAVVISIEPADDPDPAPSATKVLGGSIGPDRTFDLSVGFPAALGLDFSEASGRFILGTPTDDPDGNELSGVWFLTVPGPEPSLDLPDLPQGWAYERWAVILGIPVTTGRIVGAAGADDFSGYSGPNAGPSFPGEDFIANAPHGLTFPTDLSGSLVAITVEPDPDNSPRPFALRPLVGDVPEGIGDHVNLDMRVEPAGIGGTGRIAAG